MKTDYNCMFAEQGDIHEWMLLVDIVKDNFPGLIMEQYEQSLIKNISRQSAICVKRKDKIVGVLLFSIKQKKLSCMAVHPEHRKKGIATSMIEKMITAYPLDVELEVTTFREGDPKGEAPRALYKKLGFLEDELIMEFGYPCQKFVFKR